MEFDWTTLSSGGNDSKQVYGMKAWFISHVVNQWRGRCDSD